MTRRWLLQVSAAALSLPSGAAGQTGRTRPPRAPYQAPDVQPEAGGLRELVERYRADRDLLLRFYDQPLSSAATAAQREFYASWLAALNRVPFDQQDIHGQVDFLLLESRIRQELARLSLEEQRKGEMQSLLPFLDSVMDLKERRQRVDPQPPPETAGLLVRIGKQLDDELTTWVKGGADRKVSPIVARRAAITAEQVRSELKRWFEFYAGYDPAFTWWMSDPHKKLDGQLKDYAALIREKLTGLSKDDKDTILGDPIGRDALLKELEFEFIPYTPEELVRIAELEFAWCDREMLKASAEMGFGKDWQAALEKVKTLHVEPGQQPALILDLAMEAIEYLQRHDLVTVPPMAAASFRMTMMSPERQRFAPFFLGGETIQVSFPTDGMTHEEKLMSLRGNNIHFSRATVHHELIPGHWLQQFSNARHRPYRQVFRTPFWIEGWALYWEMLLWDRGFARSAEDRVGMLFWRMHRCARIIFSLSFHLGKMTAQQCVDFLISRVGHEPANASAEVRRSFESTYPPLYQAAYMLGGLQFRTLSQEMTAGSGMTLRSFHDRVLALNQMPVEMVRASLAGRPLQRNFKSNWRFYPGV
jgi:uncharacterized protein (DUF885 family)